MVAAHRGGALHPDNLGRENTIHAFRTAVDLGYRYVETDVRTTADGKLVIHHDADLERVTDRGGEIRSLPLAEVRRARVGGVDQIPTLDEALEEFPDVRFLIDIKDPPGAAALAERLTAHNAWDRVSVGSFGIRRLARFRRAAGARGTTAADPLHVVSAMYLPRRLRSLVPGRPAAFQVPIQWRLRRSRVAVLTPAFISAVHAAGAVVHVWTVNNTDDLHRVIDLRVDGVVTDAIDIAKEVLIERGMWEDQ
jgi:glycerophosphoryl diester phosphodiesterase